MAVDDLAEVDASQSSIVVDHRVETVHIAQFSDDLELLFVKRIADQIADQISAIVDAVRAKTGRLLLTRLEQSKYV